MHIMNVKIQNKILNEKLKESKEKDRLLCDNRRDGRIRAYILSKEMPYQLDHVAIFYAKFLMANYVPKASGKSLANLVIGAQSFELKLM